MRRLLNDNGYYLRERRSILRILNWAFIPYLLSFVITYAFCLLQSGENGSYYNFFREMVLSYGISLLVAICLINIFFRKLRVFWKYINVFALIFFYV